MDIETLKKIFADPIYCLARCPGWEIKDGKTIVTKELWIKSAMKSIEELGAEEWLTLLLQNLEREEVTENERSDSKK